MSGRVDERGGAPERGRAKHGPVPKPRGAAMPLAVVGCDFRVASTAWRAAVLLDAAERSALLERLGRSAGAEGLVVLETCNRVEWLIDAPDPRWAADLARAAMVARWRDAGMGERLPLPYVATGEDAVRHLARVVVGLQSFVVGEREIAGQLNRALDVARAAGESSPTLNALQTTLGRVVRAVERGTAFRAHARGVHSLAVEAVVRALGAESTAAAVSATPRATERARVVVAGMGEIGRKAAALAARDGRLDVVCVNRTVDADHRGAYRPWSALAALLADADALVVATGARAPVIDADALAGRAAGAAALVVVDLGAPAQVDAAVGARGDVRLLGLDDLLAEQREPVSDADRARVEALVEDAVVEARLVAKKRAAATVLRAVWDGYDELAWGALPAALDEAGAELGDEARRALAFSLREALRAHCRRVVAAVESTQLGRGR